MVVAVAGRFIIKSHGAEATVLGVGEEAKTVELLLGLLLGLVIA